MPYISTEEVAAKRKALKAALPEYKLSVRKESHSMIRVTVLEGPIEMLKDGETYTHVNHYYIDENYEKQPQVRDVLNTIYEIISQNQTELVYDSDYGSVPTFYVSINIGEWDRPYKAKV